MWISLEVIVVRDFGEIVSLEIRLEPASSKTAIADVLGCDGIPFSRLTSTRALGVGGDA